MFGVKRKVYYIIALILGICGVIILSLKIFGVFFISQDTNNGNIYTLLSLTLLLGGLAVLLHPQMKILKITNSLVIKYRQDFYTELTKNCPNNKIDITSITLNIDEKGVFHYHNITFEGLKEYEALKIISILLNDFIMIAYGATKDKKTRCERTSIDSFEMIIQKTNGTKEVYKLVEKGIINKYRY